MFWRAVARNVDGNSKGEQEESNWELDAEAFEDVIRSVVTGVPWSGTERNHVYFGGMPQGQFEDLSGITGLDDPGDGRSFALLDFDRDGWTDVALGNMNSPSLRLLRNGIGDRLGNANGFVALRFVGGNTKAAPSAEWSARDGFGTSVTLDLGNDEILYREHQPETGFLAQHTSTMIVGIGARDAIASLRVRWLSGKTNESATIPAGSLVTVYENPEASPTRESFVVGPYAKAPRSLMTRVASPEFWKGRYLPGKEHQSDLLVRHNGKPVSSDHGVTLLTTMATWCVACATEKPELDTLRAALGPHELAMYAVPVDENDTEEMLSSWMEKHQPPYELLTGIDAGEVDKVNAVIMKELRAEAVPATFLTDSTGRVLLARWGVPTVSDVRKWLWLSASEGGRMLASGGGGP